MPSAIILAAGKGTRMRSQLPKPIVPFKGKPMVQHIIDNFRKAGVVDLFLIVGHGAEQVKEKIGNSVHYVYQHEQKGTAHAVSAVETQCIASNVFVFVGDSPLVTWQTILNLQRRHEQTGASCTFLTALFPPGYPYARVLRNGTGELTGCVEEKYASASQLKINELLSSHFIFKTADLFNYLAEIKPARDNGELYLTDIIGIMLEKKLKIETLLVADYKELVGLNTPEELADFST